MDSNMEYPDNRCQCGSGKYHRNAYDGYGIYLCKVCDDCEKKKINTYRSDIFECYDCDEPIESDDY
jgi:ribosomal protein L37AE/L43A